MADFVEMTRLQAMYDGPIPKHLWEAALNADPSPIRDELRIIELRNILAFMEDSRRMGCLREHEDSIEPITAELACLEARTTE